MTPKQAKQLEDVHAMLTRTDNAGYDNVPSGHNMYGRINRIEQQLERTDNAEHKTPDGHNMFGRINLIEQKVDAMAKQLDAIAKKLSK